MTVSDFMAEDGKFSFTDGFVRLRAGIKIDPYSGEEAGVDWNNPTQLPIDAYIDSQSSVEQTDAVRQQVITQKRLVMTDPNCDVRKGDRVKSGAGEVFKVTGEPSRDRNPFTGWQPTLVVEIEKDEG